MEPEPVASPRAQTGSLRSADRMSGRMSPKSNGSKSSSPRSPFGSPGRKRSESKSMSTLTTVRSSGSSGDVTRSQSPPTEKDTPNSPRFLQNVLAKFSPIIRRRKRTESFVDSIRGSQLEDFELLKELASGFIGRVYLAQHKSTKEFFALKVMSQEGIIAQRQLERVFNEKKIHTMLSAKGSFQVVKIYKTFRDATNIYLILEYQPADLFSLLNQMKGHVMPDQDARFLTAVLVAALETMHELGVVYRDLKPQNVLIDDMGYPMLTDFGFSKILSLKGAEIQGLPPQTISFVGTPAYMAPELLKRKYYDEAVDWWALGILVYEVLLGDVPFDDHGGNYEKLLRGMEKGLVFPESFNPITRGFVEGLLHRNPDERLGANGVEEVKNHPWLRGIDWNAVREKTLPSPLALWIPKKSATPDTRNFDLYQLYEKSGNPDSPAVSPRIREEMFSGY
jgi:serine/threonine protein kinase